MRELLSLAIEASLLAGKSILAVYSADFSVETKADQSPLTEADRQSHQVIRDYLLNTQLPFLSEEGKAINYDQRKNWETFWLVDPLDGTKEFIKKNGEFTVNIALIRDGIPVAGVVFVPVTGVLYFGSLEDGSFRYNVEGEPTTVEILAKATRLPGKQLPSVYTIVASRSHSSAETESFILDKEKKYGEVTLISAGSSLKLCLVAEGKASVYPRLAPTMEWDTAAGHAVASFAGCRVYNYLTNEELHYNKPDLLNPWFVVERS